jgi:hypothetical protein
MMIAISYADVVGTLGLALALAGLVWQWNSRRTEPEQQVRIRQAQERRDAGSRLVAEVRVIRGEVQALPSPERGWIRIEQGYSPYVGDDAIRKWWASLEGRVAKLDEHWNQDYSLHITGTDLESRINRVVKEARLVGSHPPNEDTHGSLAEPLRMLGEALSELEGAARAIVGAAKSSGSYGGG